MYSEEDVLAQDENDLCVLRRSYKFEPVKTHCNCEFRFATKQTISVNIKFPNELNVSHVMCKLFDRPADKIQYEIDKFIHCNFGAFADCMVRECNFLPLHYNHYTYNTAFSSAATFKRVVFHDVVGITGGSIDCERVSIFEVYNEHDTNSNYYFKHKMVCHYLSTHISKKALHLIQPKLLSRVQSGGADDDASDRTMDFDKQGNAGSTEQQHNGVGNTDKRLLGVSQMPTLFY